MLEHFIPLSNNLNPQFRILTVLLSPNTTASFAVEFQIIMCVYIRFDAGVCISRVSITNLDLYVILSAFSSQNVSVHDVHHPYVMLCLPNDSLASESYFSELKCASAYLDCTYFILRVINTELLQIKQSAKMKLSDDVRLESVRYLGNGGMNRLAEIRLLADHIIPIFDPDPENKLSQTELTKFPTSWSRAVCHAVLGLIQKGDFNYPRLYIRLYRLLDETLFECPDVEPFLIDLDVYLSSIHLATTVVASFIKRLSQLSLFSPITITPAILLIIFNGLQNHPHCRVLINCKQKKSQKLNNIQSDDNSLPNVFNAQSIGDPYNWEADNFDSSRALESSLWEVYALIGHCSPDISSLAYKICNPDPTDTFNSSVADILDKQKKNIKEATRSVKEALYLLSQTNITMPELPPLDGWA
ncbi:U3 small nucleolar RNA-associated protein 19 [Schistosoma bovis]|uniref:U3 small nucleolar RNA-associated protein 19 n=1 Tax=Schistosoma bovis TaxID=6184 RepID=A0A430QDQ3_SCHBO|nr:U3 small nucleolar RNA-associated protein 19 [Schistosoma bovis]